MTDDTERQTRWDPQTPPGGAGALSGLGSPASGGAGALSGLGSPASGGSGAVYGLGMVGALVYYWRHADGVGGHLGAVGKSIVWPAFLVYGVLDRLGRR